MISRYLKARILVIYLLRFRPKWSLESYCHQINQYNSVPIVMRTSGLRSLRSPHRIALPHPKIKNQMLQATKPVNSWHYVEHGYVMTYPVLNRHPNERVAISIDDSTEILIPLPGSITTSMNPHHDWQIRLVWRCINAQEQTVFISSEIVIRHSEGRLIWDPTPSLMAYMGASGLCGHRCGSVFAGKT